MTTDDTRPLAMLKCDRCGDYEAIGDALVTCLVCGDAHSFDINAERARHAALVAASRALVSAHDEGYFEPWFGHEEDDPIEHLRAALNGEPS